MVEQHHDTVMAVGSSPTGATKHALMRAHSPNGKHTALDGRVIWLAGSSPAPQPSYWTRHSK